MQGLPSGVAGADGQGRRARRAAERAATGRSRRRVGPMTGWALFTLLMTAGVLLWLGVDVTTVVWVLLAGLLVAGALLLSARLSPLAPTGVSDERSEPGAPSTRPGEPDRQDPPAP